MVTKCVCLWGGQHVVYPPCDMECGDWAHFLPNRPRVCRHVVYPPVIQSAGTGHISFGIGRGLPDIHQEAPSLDF